MGKKTSIGAIDQGTTSTRCIIFNRSGEIMGTYQVEHKQYYPKPGWVEHDPKEIIEKTKQAVKGAIERAGVNPADLAGLGITNQRETTLVWDKTTGKTFGNALVWQDTRTAKRIGELEKNGGGDRFRKKTGLPLATYFSATKAEWILQNNPEAKKAAEKGTAAFGTIDTWLLWNLTGGPDGGVHYTDVTNASRTLLMDLSSLSWDEELMNTFGIPKSMLPEIVPSIPEEPYGFFELEPGGVKIPLAGVLGDQQAALFGQACFQPGESKNTYGTGCFMLANTGEEPVHSTSGLVSTVAYQRGSQAPVYALEGSIAVAGALVQWLRDNVGLIQSSSDIEALAGSVEDNGGVYFVPAFSGLFAPHWDSSARGIMAGITGYAGKGHIARAVLEATAFQTREIYDAMVKDTGMKIPYLKVDGGMVANKLLMQFQADILDRPVIRPKVTETTALGSAYAAGLCTGFWADMDELKTHWDEDTRWKPDMSTEERKRHYEKWQKAVEKSRGWEDEQ